VALTTPTIALLKTLRELALRGCSALVVKNSLQKKSTCSVFSAMKQAFSIDASSSSALRLLVSGLRPVSG